MSERAVPTIIVAVLAIGLGYLVVNSADDWSDWVVLGVIILTAIGFAIAVAPNIYARRKRTISRSSDK
jgi:hypothetical protein